MYIERRIILFRIILVAYIVAFYCHAVVFRQPLESRIIETVLLRSYNDTGSELFWDNVFNIIAFIPIGLLVGLLTHKYHILSATFAGLFFAETIECSQLIWQCGVFDVDDLLFNTIGALVGGLIVAIIDFIRRLSSRD